MRKMRYNRKQLSGLVRELNAMMAFTPMNTDDYRALLEELRKANLQLQAARGTAPIPNGRRSGPQSPTSNGR